MSRMYTRTLPLLPDEGPERRRPSPTSDAYMRHVEFPNPTVHIPSSAHQCRVPTTHRTNSYLQSHQRNHHYRDCLYNIRHNTEHKYINLDCLRARHAVNITRTPWSVTSSLPIPDTTYPKNEPRFTIYLPPASDRTSPMCQ